MFITQLGLAKQIWKRQAWRVTPKGGRTQSHNLWTVYVPQPPTFTSCVSTKAWPGESTGPQSDQAASNTECLHPFHAPQQSPPRGRAATFFFSGKITLIILKATSLAFVIVWYLGISFVLKALFIFNKS